MIAFTSAFLMFVWDFAVLGVFSCLFFSFFFFLQLLD